MKPWKRIEPTTEHKVGWRVITTKTFLLPDGQKDTFDTFRRVGDAAIVVIALTKDKKVIITRQFRVGPEKVFDEIPTGLVDKGETPEQAAQRELQEEAGYTAGSMKYLGHAYRDGYSNLTIHVFLATDCLPHEQGQKLDYNEHIEVDLVSIDQLLQNAKRAKMVDIGAVFMAYDDLQKLRRSS
jgi:ADP-ribose pyrophosphatase